MSKLSEEVVKTYVHCMRIWAKTIEEGDRFHMLSEATIAADKDRPTTLINKYFKLGGKTIPLDSKDENGFNEADFHEVHTDSDGDGGGDEAADEISEVEDNEEH